LRRTGHAGRNPSVETPRLSLQINLNAHPQQVNPFFADLQRMVATASWDSAVKLVNHSYENQSGEKR